MRIYTVHLRRAPVDVERDLEVVGEGFTWLAFLYPLSILWALAHRMWPVAAALIILPFLVNGLAVLAGDGFGLQAVLMVAAAVALGVFAGELRRWDLHRRGFVLAGVVAARNTDAAERRLFDLNPQLAEDLGP